ncbi:glycosyltransferase involved in cell wall biosynthesis [Pseudacidovorax sp. 1753]|uniref:glycosyltransferase n=1 Tax=Pseudacidovorax sp. 1753 TaxID=3156419 RepID=UPI00339966A9
MEAKKKLRILRLIPSLDPKRGGPVNGASMIDRELLKLGHIVQVVTFGDYDEGIQKNYPAPIHFLGKSYFNYSLNLSAIRWLKENAANFDKVIVNGIWQFHSYAAWAALRNSGIPYFVFTHGMLDPWFKRAYPLKHLKKWLYWPWADYRVLRDASAVLFTSEEEKIKSRESFWLYKAKEIVVSYGTSGPPENDGKKYSEIFFLKYPDLKNKRLVLFLSRIHEKKGCDLIIDAFEKISRSYDDAHLVMAGPDDSNYAKELKQKVEALGIEKKVTWTGMLVGDEKWGAYFSSDVFCLPSHQENFGIVVAEALACGRPVLISNKVNIWKEIQADACGIVNEDTAEGTYAGLAKWFLMNDQERVAMGRRASATFVRRFEIKSVASSLLAVLRSNGDGDRDS